jgi:hypothetical protein
MNYSPIPRSDATLKMGWTWEMIKIECRIIPIKVVATINSRIARDVFAPVAEPLCEVGGSLSANQKRTREKRTLIIKPSGGRDLPWPFTSQMYHILS